MKYIWLFACVLFCQSSLCQSIKGTITEEKTNLSIPYATVILKNNNGEFLAGTSSDEEGSYTLEYEKGDYIIEVTFVGYEKIIKPVKIESHSVYDFKMSIDSTSLDEVLIVSEKTTVEQLIDKKVINVGKDVLSVGGNAKTVLGQLSQVQIGPNDNISLRGSQNINVLVDGKPSPLSASEILNQIPVSQISKIEVITSPSAKYQANGLTGIINIITNKTINKGLNLKINSAANSLEGYSGSGVLGYGTPKMNYNTNISYNKRIRKNNNSQIRSGLNPFEQFNSFEKKAKVLNLDLGFDWFMNDFNEFSTKIGYVVDDQFSDNHAQIFQDNTNYIQNTIGERLYKTFNFNSNYRKYFSDKENYLEFDVQLSDNTSILESRFTPNIAVLNNNTDNDVFIVNAAIDYSGKINDNLKIEAGILWNRDHLSNSRFFTEDSNEIYASSFENTQSTFAVYSLAKYNIKKISFQIGLRTEKFDRKAFLESEDINLNNNYLSLFPSIHLSYAIKNSQTLNLGYNKRTSRPTLNQVNPISFQNNEFSANVGNPSLEPEFSNNFDLSYQLSSSYINVLASMYYGFKNNVITIHNYVNDEGINIFTPINNGYSDALGIEIGVVLKPYKWLRSSIDFSWNYEQFRNDQIGFTYNYSRYIGYSFRNQFILSKMSSIDLLWYNNGSGTSYFFTQQANPAMDIGISQKILKERGSLNLRVTDIFNERSFNGVNSGSGFSQKFKHNPVSRILYLSFSYNFNTGSFKDRKKKQRKYKSGLIN